MNFNTTGFNKPPAPWRFTGGWPEDTRRMYPDGAELRTIVVHPKWIDLMWYDRSRDVLVYLSTMPFTTNGLTL